MADNPNMMMEESGSMDSTTVLVKRTSATIKGGRRFTFNGLVIVGDRKGQVGYGYAKANEVPVAVEKATKYAKRKLLRIPMTGTTVPHQVEGRFSASTVRLIPATPGTGVVAGSTLRAILEMAGVTDCLTKCFGSTNDINIIKATFDAIEQLATREEVIARRGVQLAETDIEVRVERGRKFMPVSSGREKMRGPVNTIGSENRRGGRGGGGGRGGRGPRGGQGGGQGDAAATGAAPAGDAPKA
jgi:small subunit ribosomal protein S5